jgi:hypothetical protein
MDKRMPLDTSVEPPAHVGQDPEADPQQQIRALEPDTLPSHPLRAQDVPGFILKLIG